MGDVTDFMAMIKTWKMRKLLLSTEYYLMFPFGQCQKLCKMAVGYHKLNQVVIPIAEVVLDSVTNEYKLSSSWHLYFNRKKIFLFLFLFQ